MLSGTYTDNYISNAVFLAETNHPIFDDLSLEPGAQLTLPVNLDGYWNFRSFVTYGFPLKKIKSNLNLDLTGSYSRVPGLIDEALNYSNTKTLGVGLTLSSNISDKLDFTISSRSNFNDVSNSPARKPG